MFNSLTYCQRVGVQQYKLMLPLTYTNKTMSITVIDGFITDVASIPVVLRGIIGCPFGESYTEAAIMHDALYRSGIVTRKMADYLFLEAMLSSGTDRVLARTMYLAVRRFGESSYLGSGPAGKWREFVYINLKEI